MNVKSFAKINLGLEILRKRPDRYHDIRTLFQSINLADDIDLEPTAESLIRLEGDDPTVSWDETNLIYRAAKLLQEKSGTSCGAAIRVTKNIPPGRGLGGGSSNAAATLLALNKLWTLGLSGGALAELALSVGSDVPYFLHGGLCLGESRGEALTQLPDLPPLPCVLAFPPYPVSTASIYAGVGPSLTSEGKVSKIMRFLETGDFGLLENDLEQVIFRTYPELDGFKTFFRNQGAALAQVSGSGSAVYGLFADRDKARKALETLGRTSAALLAETLPREGYWTHVGAGV